MDTSIKIRLEKKEDFATSENLTREAFWNVYRPGCCEHFVLHRFRTDKDFVPELDFVMEKDGQIIGHIMYARAVIEADDEAIQIMTFGPISIDPAFKRRGYGKILLDYSLEKAKEMGVGAVAITGNIGCYGKSGFVVASTKGIRYAEALPDDKVVPYFLAKELIDGFLNGVSGTFKEPDGYFVSETYPEEFERYEAGFPTKEKLKLPGQLV
ncbi:MAG: N-acetyltransferase [Clostridia bacterium]|nr:N-acetyltransferase [Clostridia bacterium]